MGVVLGGLGAVAGLSLLRGMASRASYRYEVMGEGGERAFASRDLEGALRYRDQDPDWWRSKIVDRSSPSSTIGLPLASEEVFTVTERGLR